MKRIYFISGPPASGKTTLCAELGRRLSPSVHVPVDDLRLWVVNGMADSVPWTDETERQFRIAETAVCQLARTYLHAGFDVLIDHCRNPKRLEELIQAELSDVGEVVKVCLLPALSVNLDRSHTRTNKTFDPHLLDETITYTNEHYRADVPNGWLAIENSRLSVAETADLILRPKLGME